MILFGVVNLYDLIRCTQNLDEWAFAVLASLARLNVYKKGSTCLHVLALFVVFIGEVPRNVEKLQGHSKTNFKWISGDFDEVRFTLFWSIQASS